MGDLALALVRVMPGKLDMSDFNEIISKVNDKNT